MADQPARFLKNLSPKRILTQSPTRNLNRLDALLLVLPLRFHSRSEHSEQINKQNVPDHLFQIAPVALAEETSLDALLIVAVGEFLFLVVPADTVECVAVRLLINATLIQILPQKNLQIRGSTSSRRENLLVLHRRRRLYHSPLHHSLLLHRPCSLRPAVGVPV